MSRTIPRTIPSVSAAQRAKADAAALHQEIRSSGVRSALQFLALRRSASAPAQRIQESKDA
jgi:hypothetical protein